MGTVSVPKTEDRRCVILAGGPTDDGMKALLTPEDFILAADAGWQTAVRWGVLPDLALGDWDSAPMPQTDVPLISLPAEKDDTDTHYAARIAAQKGFRRVLILGGTGGRQDHMLANCATLLFLAKQGIEPVMADARTAITVLCGEGECTLSAVPGRYLSVFPMEGAAEGVCLSGVKYPLEDATLTPVHPLGVSNEITAERAHIRVKTGSLLILQAE